jgi:hypothetical protein
MIAAASGTIRIPTRRRPLTRYHNLTKIQASTQACQHNKMTTPPTHRRADAGKGCRRQIRPARHRRRTVPSLRGVAVSSQMNPYRPQGDRHSHQLTQPPRPGARAGRGPAPRSRRNRTPNGPGYSPLSHQSAHSSTPKHARQFVAPAGISEFPPAASFPPGHAVRRARRARNLSARSTDHSPSRNNYGPPPIRSTRPDRGMGPPITAKFRRPQVCRHLRRKRLAMNFPGFGAIRALKPDET